MIDSIQYPLGTLNDVCVPVTVSVVLKPTGPTCTTTFEGDGGAGTSTEYFG